MSRDEVAWKLRELESPFTDPAARHAADQWLTDLRRSPQAWSIAQEVLTPSGAPDNPSLRAHAAQIFAYKTRKCIAEITLPQQRLAAIEFAVTVLSRTALSEGAVIRQLCVSVAALLAQTPSLPLNLLQSISARLAPPVYLELFTALPAECEDAYEASLTTVPSESDTANELTENYGLQIKQRAEEWCAEVADWLSQIQTTAAVCKVQEGFVPGEIPPMTISIVRCFGAWASWGGLFYMRQKHAEHLIQSCGALMLCEPPSLSSVGVEAFNEAIERAPEHLYPALTQEVLRVVEHIMCHCASKGFDPGALPHVVALYCSTNAQRCVEPSPEGQLLRDGLLRMVKALESSSLLGHDEEENYAGSLMDALGDALEALYSRQGAMLDTEESMGFVNEAFATLMKHTNVLKRFISQRQASYLDVEAWCNRRQCAAWPLSVCGSILGALKVARHLAKALQEVAIYGDVPSLALISSIHNWFYIIGVMEDVLCQDPNSSQYVESIVNLFAAGRHLETQHDLRVILSEPALLLFHYDILSTFKSVASIVLPAVSPHNCKGFIAYILDKAMAAARVPSVTLRSFEEIDILEAATGAICALFECQKEGLCEVFVFETNAIAVIDGMLEALQVGRVGATAHEVLVATVVHALYKMPLQWTQPIEGLLSVIRQRVLAPYKQATWALSTSFISVEVDIRTLEYCVKGLEAVLNGFESRMDEPTFIAEGCSFPGGNAVNVAVHETVKAALEGVEPLLTWQRRRPSGAEELLPSVSRCICSCMVLLPDFFSPGYLAHSHNMMVVMLPYPGGHSLLRVLCTALERIGSNHPSGTFEKDAVMMDAVASVLSSSSGTACSTPRGGDSAPEIALGLLSMGASFVRNAPRWSPPPAIDPFVKCLHGILRLAVGNTACNHRDVAVRALAVLSSIVALLVDNSAPLHRVLLSFGFQQGPHIMQAAIVSLLSFTSGGVLPKVCRLTVDCCQLAVACADGMEKHSLESSNSISINLATAAYATKLLADWMAAAQGNLDRTGIIPFAASEALLAGWNWDTMAHIVVKSRQGQGSDMELLRHVQRVIRRVHQNANRYKNT